MFCIETIERMKREWLAVFDFVSFARQLDPEPVANKKLCRVREEIDQLRQVDITPLLCRFAEPRVEKG